MPDLTLVTVGCINVRVGTWVEFPTHYFRFFSSFHTYPQLLRGVPLDSIPNIPPYQFCHLFLFPWGTIHKGLLTPCYSVKSNPHLIPNNNIHPSHVQLRTILPFSNEQILVNYWPNNIILTGHVTLMITSPVVEGNEWQVRI